MAKKELKLPSKDGYELSLCIYEAKDPKAVIQFVHGMEEHKERYDAFASFMESNGFTCVTSDLRGHGKDAPILSHISDKYGDKLLIEDQKVIRNYIEENYKDVPVYLFGHSMGTIISRVLIQSEGDRYQKVALSGYVCPNPIAGIGAGLTKLITVFKGPKGHSKLITSMTMDPFKKAIEKRRTDLDWLSYNEANVDAYIADPLSGVEFTLGSYYALMKLLSRMGKVKAYKSNKECPVLLIAGNDDPCTGFEKGREASKALLEKAGYKNVKAITLKMMRHEILNEINKQVVYDYLLEFYNGLEGELEDLAK